MKAERPVVEALPSGNLPGWSIELEGEYDLTLWAPRPLSTHYKAREAWAINIRTDWTPGVGPDGRGDPRGRWRSTFFDRFGSLDEALASLSGRFRSDAEAHTIAESLRAAIADDEAMLAIEECVTESELSIRLAEIVTRRQRRR